MNVVFFCSIFSARKNVPGDATIWNVPNFALNHVIADSANIRISNCLKNVSIPRLEFVVKRSQGCAEFATKMKSKIYSLGTRMNQMLVSLNWKTVTM